MTKYSIHKFTPFQYTEYPINDFPLDQMTGKHWLYASCGKAALFHCLKSLSVSGKILIPNYVCKSVLRPIIRLHLTPIFYDCNALDLNYNYEDIVHKLDIYPDIQCVLVASMYGNPADLSKLEKLCKERHVLLVDDAAQSFGSIIDNRFVGTYGDAGFFSFSPGKATPGHMGGFFWTRNDQYAFTHKNHVLYHRLMYWSYYLNRWKVEQYYKYKIFGLLPYIIALLSKVVDVYYDRMCDFEVPILGGILLKNKVQIFRTQFVNEIAKLTENIPTCRLVTIGGKGSNNHKLVYIFEDSKKASRFVVFMKGKGIYTQLGYKPLFLKADTPNVLSLYLRVVEIPVEEDIVKQNIIKSSIDQYLNSIEK